jgi:hypothetical protein
LIFGTDILERYGYNNFILNDKDNDEPVSFRRPFNENKNEHVKDYVKINDEKVELDYLFLVLCELYGKDNIKERLDNINVTYDEIDNLKVIEIEEDN